MKIAVVDDEAPIRKWFARTIENLEEGYEITGTYRNGADALKGIIADTPDVIFADIQMPEMDGIELMRQVKARFPEIEFIILTNYAEFSYARQAVAHGAMEYLLKSEVRDADISQLLQKIQEKRKKNSWNTLKENDRESWENWLQGWGVPQKACTAVMMLRTPERVVSERYLTFLKQSRREVFLYGDMLTVFSWRMSEPLALAAEMRGLAGKFGAEAEDGEWTAAIAVQGSGEDSYACLVHAAESLECNFVEDGPILEYEKLEKKRTCSTAQIHKEYKKMTELLFLGKYEELEKNLTAFFERAESIGPANIKEYRESCRRMIIALEEKWMQLCPNERSLFIPSDMENVRQCAEYAEELIEKIVQGDAPSNVKAVRKAVEYLQNHYQEQISLSDMAKLSCLSAEYFCRIFKEETGENFITYLTILRLKKARELLLGTDMKVNRIAAMTGYETAGYFSKIYKKYYGVTPEQERNRE